MFYTKKNTEDIDQVIEHHLEMMALANPGTEEFTAMANQLEVLYRTKSHIGGGLFDPNTILTVAANLLGIVLIMSYERVNVITSRAFSFIRKV